MKFYQERPADVFINVSSTEGTPVAVMEAASCGIPVIATAVGGNTEIVSERNGTLLNPDPTPEEIAEAILAYAGHPEILAAKRKGSRDIWLERYNAEVNFRAFAERLKAIGEG
jgi:glycosyltransferase involved in cell wall biosynthesis